MDLQERLQAVQAVHQELMQVIDAGERQIEEVEREREASIRRYQEARATAELRKSFLEGQMTLLSEMMQAEALKQTQESTADDVNRFLQAAMDSTPPEQRLAMLNGMHERLSNGVESDA